MDSLGEIYRDGRGVRMDVAEAARWYRKAADAGSAVAMKSIGDMYERGAGVPRDQGAARLWYRDAEAAAGPDGPKPGHARHTDEP